MRANSSIIGPMKKAITAPMTTGTSAVVMGILRRGGWTGAVGTVTTGDVDVRAMRGGREYDSRPSTQVTLARPCVPPATGTIDSWVEPSSSTCPGCTSTGALRRRPSRNVPLDDPASVATTACEPTPRWTWRRDVCGSPSTMSAPSSRPTI